MNSTCGIGVMIVLVSVDVEGMLCRCLPGHGLRDRVRYIGLIQTLSDHMTVRPLPNTHQGVTVMQNCISAA